MNEEEKEVIGPHAAILKRHDDRWKIVFVMPRSDYEKMTTRLKGMYSLNEAFEEANKAGNYIPGVGVSQKLSNKQELYYAVKGYGGSSEIDFSPEQGEYKVEVFDPKGVKISGETTSAKKMLVFNTPLNGTYNVKITAIKNGLYKISSKSDQGKVNVIEDPTDEDSGIWNLLKRMINWVLGFFIGSDEPDIPPSTTLSTVGCSTNYYEYKIGECCLDTNKNEICDKDESTTTTRKTTTTIVVKVTIPKDTTTIKSASSIVCRTNRDCGEYKEKKVCSRGDVYLQLQSPICKSPGTKNSKCIVKLRLAGESLVSKSAPTERCDRGCQEGKCL